MRTMTNHDRRIGFASAGGGRLCGIAAWLATGMLSGCMTPNPATEPPGPPAAWVRRSTPISAAPVQYEHRIPPPTPVQVARPSAPFELLPSGPSGPDAPAPQLQTPPTTEPTLQAPPYAPAAELFSAEDPNATTSVPPTAESFAAPGGPRAPAVKQSMLDEMSSQLAALDQRLNDQAAAMEEARRQSEADRRATMQLQTEFQNWQAELGVVRDAIRSQSAADVQTLDELNQALEILLTQPPPSGRPDRAEPPQTATGGARTRETR